MDRTEIIRTRLDDMIRGACRCATAIATEAEWVELRPALEPTPLRRFGWVPPVPYDEAPLIVAICPERIAAQTEHLTDDLFEQYLVALELVIASHIELYDPDVPTDERHWQVEDRVASLAPQAFELWMGVQLRALDAVA